MNELEKYKEALAKIEELKLKVCEYKDAITKEGQNTCFSQIMFCIENGKIKHIDLLHTLFANENRIDYAVSVNAKDGFDVVMPKFICDFQDNDFYIELLNAKVGLFNEGLGYYVLNDDVVTEDECYLINKSNIYNTNLGDFFLTNTIDSLQIIKQKLPNISEEKFKNLQVDMIAAVSKFKNYLNGETTDLELDNNKDAKKYIMKDLEELLTKQRSVYLKNTLDSDLETNTKPKRKMKL